MCVCVCVYMYIYMCVCVCIEGKILNFDSSVKRILFLCSIVQSCAPWFTGSF